MNEKTTSVSDLMPESQIERISNALKLVFGDSPEGRELRRKCEEAHKEIDAIRDHRGVKATTIAVIGSKNAGKSWLCRQLVGDEAKRARIPSGEESNTSTEKATWIGPDGQRQIMGFLSDLRDLSDFPRRLAVTFHSFFPSMRSPISKTGVSSVSL